MIEAPIHPELEKEQILQQQRQYFHEHHTLDVGARLESLKRLQAVLVREETHILKALNADLGKAPFEAYETELGFILEELRFNINHLRDWSRPKRVPTPLLTFPASSWIYPEPLGLVLIISPWNYPFQLTFAPFIAAIAAGNCAVVKPSRHAPHTARVTESILREAFDPRHVSVFQGGEDTNTWLLKNRFDHIFFTGSPAVGRVVLAAAAPFLTPVSLELGGKSPCIVDASANVDMAARRIAWGKCVNSGQTCVAPDYLLVHKDVKDAFVERFQFYIRQFYGEDPLSNPEFPKIVNERHFTRLCGLMQGLQVLTGGLTDPAARKIEPTLFGGVTLDDAIMREEIFGPLLPVLEFEHIDEALAVIQHFEKPLALYLFTRDRAIEQRILASVPFGGGCVNDVIMHLANPYLPFGGVGESGMGSYHGKRGFETFSHLKSVLKKSDRLDLPLIYPPFRDHLKIIKRLLK
jgi:aldehyde dehydrogenase (NAD+)